MTLQEVDVLRTDTEAWFRIMTAAQTAGYCVPSWLATLDDASRRRNGTVAFPHQTWHASLSQPTMRLYSVLWMTSS